MTTHDFIFTPGVWLGEGTISLPASSELIHFFTKWSIERRGACGFRAEQIVEMQGIVEPVVNQWFFNEIESGVLQVTLESAFVGKVVGKGAYCLKSISWTFERGVEDSEQIISPIGSEYYERGESGLYYFRARYGMTSSFGTMIDGYLWRKSTIEHPM